MFFDNCCWRNFVCVKCFFAIAEFSKLLSTVGSPSPVSQFVLSLDLLLHPLVCRAHSLHFQWRLSICPVSPKIAHSYFEIFIVVNRPYFVPNTIPYNVFKFSTVGNETKESAMFRNVLFYKINLISLSLSPFSVSRSGLSHFKYIIWSYCSIICHLSQKVNRKSINAE